MIRVLFVDDETRILSGIRRMLHAEKGNIQAAFAESGKQALEILEENAFDIVIADMRMPSMNGVELLEEVRKGHPQIIRIILSGQSDQDMIYKALRPAHQFLAKPCRVEDLISVIKRAFRLKHVFVNSSMGNVISQIDSLPSYTASHGEVMRLLDAADPDLSAIGESISRDIALTADLLKLVNSSFFGLCNHISDPRQAVTLLGIDIMRSLVLTVQFFSGDTLPGGYDLHLDMLQRHSFRVAESSRCIARSLNLGRTIMDDCFAAGLLHDVGVIIVAMNFSKDYLGILKQSKKEGVPLHVLEKEKLGMSHAEIGAYLLALWGLKDEIVQAVFYHHEFEKAESDVQTECLPIVHAANHFDHEVHGDAGGISYGEPDKERIDAVFGEGALDGWRELHAGICNTQQC